MPPATQPPTPVSLPMFPHMSPRTRRRQIVSLLLLALLIAVLSACNGTQEPKVVIYTSVDQVFSEPILQAFEDETGIQVEAIYDVEAAKTTGLVNRLIAEKERPLADVWWSGEFAQTILLQEEEVLAPYRSANAEGIPAAYRDPDDYWTGFAGRARVILINTDLVPAGSKPTGLADFLDPTWPSDKLGIAYPLFGTTATHAAALYAGEGQEAARSYFQQLADRGVQVVDGNSVVRDQVADGTLAFGLTDTDDACGAVRSGAPVEIIFPDQGAGERGTLIVPNTVALIAGGPNSENGQALIDYLLSLETAEELIASDWSHVTLRPVDASSDCLPNPSVQGMSVGLAAVYEQLQPSQTDMAEIFVR